MSGHIDERWVRAQSSPSNSQPPFLNPKVSVYWLWLVMVFGGIAALPCLSIREKLTNAVQHLPIATAYSEPHLFDDWQAILLCHAFIALFVAVPAAVLHTVIRRKRGLVEPVHFRLRQVLAGTGILALVFGFLAWHEAPPVVFCVILLFASGWPATLILAGIIDRKGVSKEGDNRIDDRRAARC